MYVLKVIKSSTSTEAEFTSAIQSAMDCINSVLEDESVDVSSSGNEIVIANREIRQPMRISISECKNKVKGCFCDSEGQVYPEFDQVILPNQSAP